MQTQVRDLMALEAQRKDKERKEGRSKQRTEEIHDTGDGRGFCLFEEAPLVWEAQDANVGCYMTVAAAVQSAAQYYRGIYDKENRAST